MKTASLKLVYFSPTGTTKKIVEAIARGIGLDLAERVDITTPAGRQRAIETWEDELLIVGAPVYFGRVQTNAIQWLNTIRSHRTPTVCVVVYGNREYDDALLELRDAMAHNGCVPVACGAYIGEHSFSSTETPIAACRPDAADLLHAQSFGERIRKKIASVPQVSQIIPVTPPGQYPYIEMEAGRQRLREVNLASVGGHCTQCGKCAELCPAGAIDFENSALVDHGKCILCHACIKHCPAGARKMKNEIIKSIANHLSGALQERKEPLLYW